VEGQLSHGAPSAQQPRRGRASIWIALLGLVFVAAGLATCAWAVQTALDARKLNGDGVRTTAQVRDTQISTVRSNKTTTRQHQVRYSFKVKGDDTTYRAEDDVFLYEQDDVWVDVPREVWERSRTSGTIEIEYLESDPSLNQPLSARRGYFSAGLFLLLGLGILGVGLLFVVGGLRRRPVHVEPRHASQEKYGA
jgi:hypothetical protein